MASVFIIKTWKILGRFCDIIILKSINWKAIYYGYGGYKYGVWSYKWIHK